MEPKIILLTGLSGSGKSTLSKALKKYFDKNDILNCILDGDILRLGLNSDLGLSPKDRDENIRRTFEVANILANVGCVVVCAVISPYENMRVKARKASPAPFYEIYIKCHIDECRKRDPKGLYAKHDSGLIQGMTGLDAPYEIPSNPDLVIETDIHSIEDCLQEIVGLIS